MGLITRDQVHEALDVQKHKGGPLGQILIDLDYITDDMRTMALAHQTGMEAVDLTDIEISHDIIELIPPQMANAYKIIPLEYEPDTKKLTIALASADNFRATDDLRTLMGFDVTAKIADPTQLLGVHFLAFRIVGQGEYFHIPKLITGMKDEEDALPPEIVVGFNVGRGLRDLMVQQLIGRG